MINDIDAFEKVWEFYQSEAMQTEAPIDYMALQRMTANARSLHAIFGIMTESGELTDAFKSHLFYGKPLDKINIEEELGDLFWYIAILTDGLEIDLSTILVKNINKLRARYPEKFTQHTALNRSLDTERGILEREINDKDSMCPQD